MKKERIVRMTFEEALAHPSRIDWAKVDATTDDDIERQIDEDGDRQFLDAVDWSRAAWIEPIAKQPISIRLDADILSFFRSKGPGYQSLINQVLRHYMESAVKKAG
jgi:uncharacterized protein (DUF4415 family)